MQIARREFLKGVSATTVSASVGGTGAWAGANDRIRIAVLGTGGRGGEHTRTASSIKGVEVAALCDPDEARMAKWAAELTARTGKTPKLEWDLRKVIEDRDIDAVSIATCNHWHSLAAIWACQAGKHVYVEKPVSHNLWEGRQLVAAARKYDRVVQTGTQRRSNGRLRKAIQLLREGVIGDIYLARCIHFQPRESIGVSAPETPAPGFHWDLWIGPGPMQPYRRNLAHYRWHWTWGYGNGEMGNNGSHHIDMGRWGMNKKFPARVYSIGGRYGYKDQGETPNTQLTTYEFDDGTELVFEIRGRFSNDELGFTPESNECSGTIFYGSKGHLACDWYGNTRLVLGANKKPEPDLGTIEDIDRYESQDASHYHNFIDAVRAGKREILTAEVEEGHISAAYCHLGNISYRLNRRLQFDAASERCTGDDEANLMLAGEYRKPFVVPARV